MTTGDYAGGSDPSELRTVVANVLSSVGEFEAKSDGATTVFTNGIRFAELLELRKWADLAFVLAGPIESSRIRDLALTLPEGWKHTVRLYIEEDVDPEVAGWLAQAHEHAERGDLALGFSPLTRDQLGLFSATFGSLVAKVGMDLFIPLPSVIQTALGGEISVVVHVSGIEYDTDLRYVADRAYIPVDDVTGLLEGRSTEVALKVRF